MDIRLFKQLKVIGIMLGILIVLLVVVYFVFIYQPPSCFDGIKNQDEENIDCGGMCLTPCELEPPEAPIIVWNGYFDEGDGYYSLAAKIRNRNNNFGTREIEYVFTAKNNVGDVLEEIPGKTFIGPGQTRYVIQNRVLLPDGVSSVALNAYSDKIKWERMPLRYSAVDFQVYAKNFGILNRGQFYAEASGIVRNETSYDFRVVEIDVFLYNNNSEAIAVRKTVIGDLRSGEEREFKVFWTKPFEESYDIMDAIPQTNFFENDNYMRDIGR